MSNGETVSQLEEHHASVVSGALWTVREKSGERPIYRAVSHPVVPITAAGLQGEQPLVNGIMWVREVGKIDSKLRDKNWLLG